MSTDDAEIKKKTKALLSEMLGCRNVIITRRGNSAILYALRAARALGCSTVIIPDQGGWLTYEQFPGRLKMSTVRVKTDFGRIILPELENVLKENRGSVLLLASLAGYFVELPVSKIYSMCRKYKVLFINDACGSIGTKIGDGEKCDMILGSFRKYKPLTIGDGGFFGCNDPRFLYEPKEDHELDYALLYKRLKGLPERQGFLRKRAAEVKQDLKDMDIIHREEPGLNVIVRFKSKKERQKIIDYCNSRELEFTECPRYIRVLDNAISIEIKRL